MNIKALIEDSLESFLQKNRIYNQINENIKCKLVLQLKRNKIKRKMSQESII